MDELLSAIKDRLAAATPGPWELAGGNEWLSPLGIDVGSEDESSRPTLLARDAEFIVCAHAYLPKLVDALVAVLAITGHPEGSGNVVFMASDIEQAMEKSLAGAVIAL